MATEKTSTRVIIPNVTLSYVHLLRPRAAESGQDAKYSAVLIIPKTDTKTIGLVKEAIKAAYEAGVASKFEGKHPPIATMRLPLRDGDNEKPDDENFKNAYFINASSKTRPGIIDRNRRDLFVEGNDDEVYSGIKATVSVNFYAYNTKGNKGVAAGLNNVLKEADGPFLGGRSSAENDFAELLGETGEAAGSVDTDDWGF